MKSAVLWLPRRWMRWRRRGELRQTLPGLGEAELTAMLDRLPLPPGGAVLVHSSLKSLGYVEGGAAAVVRALVESVVARRGGTVMLPTYTIDGGMEATLRAAPTFDLHASPSNLGAIPEAFRRHPEARRSLHPTHSFAAIGPRAAWLVSGHHLAGTNFGRGTPMGRLIEAEGHLLGLGSDIGHVTFYHCLEDMEPFPIPVYAADGPFAARCIDAEGREHRLACHAHASGPLQARRIDHPANGHLRAFFTARLEEEAGLSWHRVGQARCWLVGAAPTYRTIRALMQRGITIYSPAAELDAARAPVGATPDGQGQPCNS